jgi:hypothetical protein
MPAPSFVCIALALIAAGVLGWRVRKAESAEALAAYVVAACAAISALALMQLGG